MNRLSDFQAISWLLFCAIIAIKSYISNAQTLTPACGQTNVRTQFGGQGDVPQMPCVPTLAYDQSSIWLVWNKPDNYASQQIVDYNVYMDGKLLGNASSNAAKYSPAAPYFAAFYAEDKQKNFHTKITQHSFKVTGLKPNTVYSFTIRSVQANGKVSLNSAKVVAKTAPVYVKIVDVSKQGAKGDGKTLNTAAIQNAINSCSKGSTSAFGCKVLIPAGGVYLTGALFLRSNMTLEIAEGATLRGSTNASDYPLSMGYQIYSYFTNPTDDRRPPSLLNLLSDEHRNGPKPLTDHQGYDERRGIFMNVRITGRGTLDGNGWLRSSSDLEDEVGNKVPKYDAGSSSTWNTLGVLAKNQMEAAQSEVGGTLNSSQNANFYSNRRSSLATFRGVRNIYVDNIAFLTDCGLRIKSTPPTGGGVRRLVFRDTAMREVGTRNAVSAGGRNFTNAGQLGSPVVLTLAYSAGSNEFKNAAKSAVFKDPNAPKRPLSSYNLWLKENRDKIKKPGMTMVEVNQAAGVKWKALVDKSNWIKMAADDKVRYEREMAAYGGQ